MADNTDIEIWLEDFLAGLLDRAGLDLGIEEMSLDEDDHLNVQLAGADAALAIGRDGQGLEALQHLVIAAAIHSGVTHRRILLDIEGYRGRREQRVRDEAERFAEEAIDSGEEQELAPMSPRERRLVHLVVAEIDGVTTESAGEGADRYVRILPSRD